MALTERWSDLTIASALANRATTDPQVDFLASDQGVTSFGQVESRAEALAASLSGLGIEEGDRIALVLPSCPEFVISLFAAAKLEAVVVPLNPRLTQPELQYMLRHSEAVAAVTVESLGGQDYLQLFEEMLGLLPDLHYLITVGEEDLWYDDRFFQWEDIVSAGEGRNYRASGREAPDDLFAILYTSGTTGKPKGVELSHRNLLEAAARTVGTAGLGPEDRVVGVPALFHVFGIGPGILGCLLAGASLVTEPGEDGDSGLDLIERYRPTVHYGVPTLFVRELRAQEVRPRDVSSLRMGIVAGAPVSDDLLGRIEERLCPRVLVAYSLTETASALSMTRPGDPDEKRRFTVGRPFPGTRIRVVDEEGAELPPESLGQISVKGPGVMKGYYRQPRETKNSFDADGYFLTGDLGIVDEEGYIHLVSRRKEVIIRGGFNVYPREVEDRLHAHPAVREVAVVGIPDPVLGEAICACIVPVEGAIVTGEEIRDWCRDTLADHKVPDVVRFLDEFPQTGTGKIRRVELARMVQAEEPEART